MKKRIAFLLYHGIEVRHFLLSGLADQLKDAGHDIVILKKEEITSPVFNEYLDRYNLKVIELPSTFFPKKRTRLEELFSSIRKARLRLKKIGNFQHEAQNKTSNYWKDIVLGNNIIYKIMRWLVLKKISSFYHDKGLQDFLAKHNLTDIFFLGYSAIEKITIAESAKRLNIELWITINTWKNLYINDFVPFIPKGVFLWSDTMLKEYLICNDHIPRNNFFVAGNLAFDRFNFFTPVNSEHHYREKYNLPEESPIILFSLIFKKMYADEHKVAELIHSEIINIFGNSTCPTVLIRRNPFEREGDLEDWNQELPLLRWADHGWERDEANGWSIQSILGEEEWVDLLHYSKVNINIASLVSLEALMLNTHVINIGFGADGQENEIPMRFANSPYYKFMRDRKDLVIAKDINEFNKAITEFIKTTESVSNLPSIIGQTKERAADIILRTVTNTPKHS